jgi:hypothetical protein
MSTDADRRQKAEAKRLKRGARKSWVKVDLIADLFDVDEGTVYRGEAGMSVIRSAYLPRSQGSAVGGRGLAGTRRARRFWWPDALRLKEQMLEQSAPPRELPAGIARLLEHRGRRRAS